MPSCCNCRPTITNPQSAVGGPHTEGPALAFTEIYDSHSKKPPEYVQAECLPNNSKRNKTEMCMQNDEHAALQDA